MSPRLPKEVVAAIELAINLAHSQGHRPDLESIAAIFFTTCKSVSLIRRRINTISSTGIDPRKKSGPKEFGGAGLEEIEKCIREVTERDKEVDLNGIVREVKQRLDVELGRSTVSRFINKRGIPFIGGRGGPKGKGGTGRGRVGVERRKKARAVDTGRETNGTASEASAAQIRTTYSSLYTLSVGDENAANLARIYGSPGQNPVAHGPYS